MQGPVVPFLPPSFGSFLAVMSFFVMLGVVFILAQNHGLRLFNAIPTLARLQQKLKRAKTFSLDQENTAGQNLPSDERLPRDEHVSSVYTPN